MYVLPSEACMTCVIKFDGGPDIQITSPNHSMQKHFEDHDN